MDENAATPKIPLASSDTELPKKYIRTFAGDMETVKKGGTPDLVPLQEPPQAVVEKIVVPPPPVAPVATPISTPALVPATITIAPPPEESEPVLVVTQK